MSKKLLQTALSIICICAFGVTATTFAAPVEPQKKEKEIMTIQTGKKVSLEYTLTDESKKVIDSNVGGSPLNYVQGSSQIIPGLEKELEGLKIGDQKNVTVKPEEAYGPIIKEAVFEVGKEQMPADAYKVGAQVQGTGPGGQPIHGMVIAIKEDKATLDFNHPLAGKTLFFDVKVLGIE